MTMMCGPRGIVAIALVLIVVSVATAQYSGGNGTAQDPYQIATAADLIALGATPDDYDKHFILTADIDLDPNLPGGKVFIDAVVAPLRYGGRGFAAPLFAGVFDGRNHTISHLTMAEGGALGLLGGLGSGAVLVNLRLEAVDIHGGGVGSLVSYNEGIIANSYSAGAVSGSGVAGGLVGTNLGSIANCGSAAGVSGNQNVGGLVGENHYSGTITNCCSIGAVSGNQHVGGLVGSNSGSVVSCFWDMETSGQTASAGGVGLATGGMQDIGTYLAAGWDFVDESPNGTCDWWQTSPGEYPKLRYLAGGRPVMPEGSGTVEEPYLIRDAADLGCTAFEPRACYRLEASLDLTGIAWSGPVVPYFAGTLDGNGQVISNLHIEGGSNLGMVGHLARGATISNLGLEAADVNGVGDQVGGLAGWNYGGIANCNVSGAVVGRSWGIGGLVGWNCGSIADSHSVCTVSGTKCVGSLAGINWHAAGNITRSSGAGAVSALARVGGLVGWNMSRISNCYSTGAASGLAGVGGLVGEHSNLGSVSYCYSVAQVEGNGPGTGGLIGQNNWGEVLACFRDIQASRQTTSAAGTGKTTAEMQSADTFVEAGWDFVDETANGTEDIWWIDEGKDYPRLSWEPRPPVRLPVVELDAASFDAGIAEGVVLVDLFATWCSHCTTQAPILEEVADRLEGRAQVAKLDVDKAQPIAQRYRVTAIPTLIQFREGVEVKRFVGVTSADVLVAAILEAVDSPK